MTEGLDDVVAGGAGWLSLLARHELGQHNSLVVVKLKDLRERQFHNYKDPSFNNTSLVMDAALETSVGGSRTPGRQGGVRVFNFYFC